MARLHELDTESIGNIALIFIDGDLLEDVLLDKYGHPDYDFDKFNALKKALMKVERINSALDLTAILWQLRPDNPDMALPLVCGSALLAEGWLGCRPNEGSRERVGEKSLSITAIVRVLPERMEPATVS